MKLEIKEPLKINNEDLTFAITEVEDASFHLSWVDPCDEHEKFSDRLLEVMYLLIEIRKRL
jgi:hypothetical protein